MTLDDFKVKVISQPLYHSPDGSIELENILEEIKDEAMQRASNIITKSFKDGTGKYLEALLNVEFSLVVSKFKEAHFYFYKNRGKHEAESKDVSLQGDKSSGKNEDSLGD